MTALEVIAPGPMPAERADTADDAKGMSGRGTVSSLLARNERLECAIYRDVPGSEAEIAGTFFMHEGQLRGDFVVPEAGTTTSVTSMALKDQVLYVWAEVSGKWSGVKKDLATSSAEVTLDAREPVPLEAPVRYECKPWQAYDPSVFTPPSDVLFRDLADIQSAGMEYGNSFAPAAVPEVSKSCTACALITEDGPREQCEIRFACGLQPN